MSYLLDALRFAVLPTALIGIYFAFLKFGHKVGATCKFRFNRTEAPGIGEVVLTNLKDRSTPIFSLYAVQGNVAIPLIKFDSPLVLKSFDSVKIDIPPVSEYLVDGKPFEFSNLAAGAEYVNTQIFYSTHRKFKRCVSLDPPIGLPASITLGRQLKPACAVRHVFNGEVYSPNIIYILEYKVNGRWQHAFVDSAGLIHWGMAPNGLPGAIISMPQVIADSLLADLPHVEQLMLRKTFGWNRLFQAGATFQAGKDDAPIEGSRRSPHE